jgi:hypothetical protein
MLDFFNIPDGTANTTIFYANNPTGSSDNSWQTWSKPENCTFVSIIAIGGGGAGSAGGAGAVSQVRNGGKGGGSSSITKTLYPAWALPSTLYIQVGNGGLGGSGSASGTILATGSNGQLSYVSIIPTSSANYILVKSGNAPSTGGGPGYTQNGAGGTAATIAFWNYLGLFESEVGVAGANGGNSTANGTSVTPSFITCPGAGGGSRSSTNVSTNGGMVISTVLTPEIPSGSATGNVTGSDGVFTSLFSSNGSIILTPLYLGGAGGAGSATIGGPGGRGSYGSGGGGGGAALTGGSGLGGNGGDGLVIITAF